MSNPLNTLRSLRHPRGAGRPARVRVFAGTGAPKTGRGTGASKTGLRLILSVLAATLGVLAFASAPALAAISPTVTIKPAGTVTSTTARVSGTVNPNGGPMTVWDFEYAKDSETEGWTPSTLAGPALADEEVKGTIEGLEPNTAYEVRLVATNEEGGEGFSAEPNPTFKTAVSKPTVISLSAPLPKIEEARLEATVNPSNETTECHFELSRENGSEIIAPKECEQGNALEGGEQVVGLTVTGLKPDTTYHYQVQLKNATGETTDESTFTTAIHPETPTGLKVEAITANTATLRGVLNPKAAGDPGSYEFLYKASAKECEGGEAASGDAAGGREEMVESKPTLLPNTTYTVCLRARNEAGEESTLTSPVTFTTLVAAPKIESESSIVVDTTEARLEAEINPGNSETTYHFEYGPSAGSYDANIPSVSAHIPAGLTAKSVNAVATGLAPSTTYHYRAVASNALQGVVEYGSDQTFTTPAAAASTGTHGGCENEKLREEQPYGLQLPDCRAYEMVSPPNTNGQDATSFHAESVARASEAKEQEPAITYSAKGSYGNPEGALVENQYLSRRTPTGWTTQNITPLSTPAEREEHEGSYPTPYFTPELTEGLAVTNAQLAEAPLLRGNYGLYVMQFASHTNRFVGITEAPLQGASGASRDLERVVLSNRANGRLFEWVDGTGMPVTVSITNTREEIAAKAGAPSETYNHYWYGDAWHAVSEDGSRVYFTSHPYAREGAISQLFVRVNIDQPHTGKEQSELNSNEECTEPTKACTIEVSAPAPGVSDLHGPQSARYWGASANGEKVFFTSSSELTQNAYTGEEDKAPNLYEYDLATHDLTDLTVDTADKAEGAAVEGVVQISENGSYVYFVAKGALAAGASEQQCREETEEEKTGEKPKQTNLDCNLYVSHNDEAPVFIATLAAKDQTDWLNGTAPIPALDAGPEVNTAVVSPDGAQLAFISERSLPTVNFPAGYDNEPANPSDCGKTVEGTKLAGEKIFVSLPCQEVYLYDAGSESRPPTLVCASCNPTGARPVGPSNLAEVNVDTEPSASYRPRELLADGMLFFDSKDALVQHASGGIRNVYEYENGVVHAISNVAGGYESFFLDASPNGENVFLGSADKLLPEDPGGNTVVWDAREDGGYPVAPPECTTAEACRNASPSTPFVYGPPPSATFSGPGNLTPSVASSAVPVVKPKPKPETRMQKLKNALAACRKDKSRTKRVACEVSVRKRYGSKVKPKANKKAKGSK